MTARLSQGSPSNAGAMPRRPEVRNGSKLLSVSPSVAQHGDEPPMADNVFLAPRIVDQAAFEDFAGSLRGLIEQANTCNQQLSELVKQVREHEAKTNAGAAQLHEGLRLGARMLKAFQTQIEQAERSTQALNHSEHIVAQRAEVLETVVAGAIKRAELASDEVVDARLAQLDQAIESRREKIGEFDVVVDNAVTRLTTRIDEIVARALAEVETAAQEQRSSISAIDRALTDASSRAKTVCSTMDQTHRDLQERLAKVDAAVRDVETVAAGSAQAIERCEAARQSLHAQTQNAEAQLDRIGRASEEAIATQAAALRVAAQAQIQEIRSAAADTLSRCEGAEATVNGAVEAAESRVAGILLDADAALERHTKSLADAAADSVRVMAAAREEHDVVHRQLVQALANSAGAHRESIHANGAEILKRLEGVRGEVAAQLQITEERLAAKSHEVAEAATVLTRSLQTEAAMHKDALRLSIEESELRSRTVRAELESAIEHGKQDSLRQAEAVKASIAASIQAANERVAAAKRETDEVVAGISRSMQAESARHQAAWRAAIDDSDARSKTVIAGLQTAIEQRKQDSIRQIDAFNSSIATSILAAEERIGSFLSDVEQKADAVSRRAADEAEQQRLSLQAVSDEGIKSCEALAAATRATLSGTQARITELVSNAEATQERILREIERAAAEQQARIAGAANDVLERCDAMNATTNGAITTVEARVADLLSGAEAVQARLARGLEDAAVRQREQIASAAGKALERCEAARETLTRSIASSETRVGEIAQRADAAHRQLLARMDEAAARQREIESRMDSITRLASRAEAAAATCNRMDDLVRRLEPWRGLLLDSRMDDLPAPISRLITDLREGLAADMSSLAGALRGIAHRADSLFAAGVPSDSGNVSPSTGRVGDVFLVEDKPAHPVIVTRVEQPEPGVWIGRAG